MMPASHLAARRRHFEAEMARPGDDERPAHLRAAFAGVAIALVLMVAAAGLIALHSSGGNADTHAPATHGGATPNSLLVPGRAPDIPIVNPPAHQPAVHTGVPVFPFQIPSGVGAEVNAHHPVPQTFVQPYPQPGIEGLDALIVHIAAPPTGSPASFAPLFSGHYDFHGNILQISVVRPNETARQRGVELGGDPQTVLDADGIPRTTYYRGAKVYSTEFATEDVVVTISPVTRRRLPELYQRRVQAKAIQHLRFLRARVKR